MTKFGWILVGTVVLCGAAIGFGVSYLLSANRVAHTPEITATSTEQRMEKEQGDQVGTSTASTTPSVRVSRTVTYTDSGFSPTEVNIAIGDTVHFVNNTSNGMWVGVDAHPTHTAYDGTNTREHCAGGKNTNGSFDACTPTPKSSTYDYTFTKAG